MSTDDAEAIFDGVADVTGNGESEEKEQEDEEDVSDKENVGNAANNLPTSTEKPASKKAKVTKDWAETLCEQHAFGESFLRKLKNEEITQCDDLISMSTDETEELLKEIPTIGKKSAQVRQLLLIHCHMIR